MTTVVGRIINSRREFLGGTTRWVLSAGAVALLGNREALAAGSATDAKADVSILNVAVGLEHEGINAYTIALKSGLLSPAHVKAATKFQDDHKAHRDALIATIGKLGGTAVAEKSMADYEKSLKTDQLKNEDDVLSLAARLELGATNAYLGVIPAFHDIQLSKIAGRLAAEEATHFALLNFDLHRPLAPTMSFGA
jgi:rubrerythrin